MKLKPLLALFLSGFLIALARPAYPQDAKLNADGTLTITLSADQVKQCMKEGGCSVVTGAYEQKLIEEAAKAGRKQCGTAI